MSTPLAPIAPRQQTPLRPEAVAELEQARRALADTATSPEASADPALRARILTKMAQIDLSLGSFDAALVGYRMVERELRETGDVAGQAHAEYGIAETYLAKGECRRALDYYTSASQAFLESGDCVGRARAEYGIAEIHLANREYDPARELYAGAQRAFAEAGDAADSGRCWLALAEVDWRDELQSDSDRLLRNLEHALGDFDALGDALGRAHVFFRGATVQRGNEELADRLFAEASEAYRELCAGAPLDELPEDLDLDELPADPRPVAPAVMHLICERQRDRIGLRPPPDAAPASEQTTAESTDSGAAQDSSPDSSAPGQPIDLDAAPADPGDTTLQLEQSVERPPERQDEPPIDLDAAPADPGDTTLQLEQPVEPQARQPHRADEQPIDLDAEPAPGDAQAIQPEQPIDLDAAPDDLDLDNLDFDDVVLEVERISAHVVSGEKTSPARSAESVEVESEATGAATTGEDPSASTTAAAVQAHDETRAAPASTPAPRPPGPATAAVGPRRAAPAPPVAPKRPVAETMAAGPPPAAATSAAFFSRARITALGVGAVALAALVSVATSLLPGSEEGSASASQGQIAANQSDPYELAKALEAEGDLAIAQGNSAAARGKLRRALASYGQLGRPSDEARLAAVLADFEYEQGQPARALELFEKAHALQRGLGDQQGLRQSGERIAAIEAELEQQGALRQAILDRLAERDAANDRPGKIALLGRLIALDREQRRLDKASKATALLAQLEEEAGDTRAAAQTLDRLAELQWTLDDRAAVRQTLNRSLALHRLVGDNAGELRTLEAQGDLEVASGNWNAARELYLSVLDRFEGADRARILLKLGDVDRMLGSEDSAIERYQFVLDACERNHAINCQAEAHRRFAKVEAFNHRTVAALASYRRSAELFALIGNDAAHIEVVATRPNHRPDRARQDRRALRSAPTRPRHLPRSTARLRGNRQRPGADPRARFAPVPRRRRPLQRTAGGPAGNRRNPLNNGGTAANHPGSQLPDPSARRSQAAPNIGSTPAHLRCSADAHPPTRHRAGRSRRHRTHRLRQ